MPITITCPQCQKKLNAPDTAVGKKIRCPACKAVIDVPAEEPLEEPEKFEQPDEESAVTEEAPKRKPRPSEGITEEEPKSYGLDEDDANERERRREKKRRRFRDDDDDFEDDFGDMRPRRRTEPHRGGVIMTLGILSIPGACLPLIAFILASIALNMANTDKPKMERGQMDRSGMGSVTAGQVCAYIGIIFGLINCVLGIALQVGGKF